MDAISIGKSGLEAKWMEEHLMGNIVLTSSVSIVMEEMKFFV